MGQGDRISRESWWARGDGFWSAGSKWKTYCLHSKSSAHNLWVTLVDLFRIFRSTIHDFESSRFDHLEDSSLMSYALLPNIDSFDGAKITITNKSFHNSHRLFKSINYNIGNKYCQLFFLKWQTHVSFWWKICQILILHNHSLCIDLLSKYQSVRKAGRSASSTKV